MALRKKKVSGVDSPSTHTDPLLDELSGIFFGYPLGAAIAYGFLTTEASSPFLDIQDGDNTWRVRRNCIDRYVNGVSDRVELQWKKNS